MSNPNEIIYLDMERAEKPAWRNLFRFTYERGDAGELLKVNGVFVHRISGSRNRRGEGARLRDRVQHESGSARRNAPLPIRESGAAIMSTTTLERTRDETAEPESWRNRYRFTYDIGSCSIKVDGLPITSGWESVTPVAYPSRDAALEAHYSETPTREAMRARWGVEIQYLGPERDQ